MLCYKGMARSYSKPRSFDTTTHCKSPNKMPWLRHLYILHQKATNCMSSKDWPDEVKRKTQQFSHLSEELQNRQTAGRSVPTIAVPTGLKTETTSRRNYMHVSPIDTVAPYTHDVEFAARITIEQKGSIDEWRRTQFDRLTKLVTKFVHVDTQLQAGRSRNSRRYRRT